MTTVRCALWLAAILAVGGGAVFADTLRSGAETDDSGRNAGTAEPEVDSGLEVAERIVLDERVLFDANRARVKRAGRAQLERIVSRWRDSPGWDHIHIEGHTDSRGAEAYNRWLAFERGERVRKVLTELGVDPARLEVWSFGESRARARGDDERAHRRNRRVELVVLSKPDRDAAVRDMVGSMPLFKAGEASVLRAARQQGRPQAEN
jgi:outer membrane protein OmpA-like peptidoglycan-associated protein